MRFTITANQEEQCFDIRVQRGMRGTPEAHKLTTKDLLAWLQREICSETFGELRLDTQAVDTSEPRYLADPEREADEAAQAYENATEPCDVRCVW